MAPPAPLPTMQTSAWSGASSLRNLHVEVERLAELVLVGHARLEALVAHRVVGPRIVVVAREGELLADPDARPQHVPRHRRPARQFAEVPLEERAPVTRLELRQRHAPRGERCQLHPVQRQPVHPAPVRGDLADVGLDVVRHVARRDRLRPAGDEHVGHRLERPVGARPQEAERVPLPPRLPVGQEQHDPEDQGDARPDAEHEPHLHLAVEDRARARGRDQVEELDRDRQEQPDDDRRDQRHVAAHRQRRVGGQHRERRAHHDGVRDEGQLDRELVGRVDQRRRAVRETGEREQAREHEQQHAQPALGPGERRSAQAARPAAAAHRR